MIVIKGYSKRIIIVSAILVLSLLLGACDLEDGPKTSLNDGEQLKVHFIDVGQGDSSLIELPNGKNALIDGGPRSSSEQLMKYLRAEGIKEIEYLIVTHPHEDHIGGLPEVLKNIKVNNVYMPDKTTNTKIFESLLKEIQSQNLKINMASAGDLILDEGGLSLRFVGPVRTDYDNTNDFSIVTRVDYGDTSLLVMGDAESRSEKDIIESGQKLKADVLRVGHHGSSTSSTMEFLDKVDAKDYVMSLGVDNSYGHPHRETMDSLALKDGNIYRTDEMGTIVMVSDGKTIGFNQAPEVIEDVKGNFIGNKNTKIYHDGGCNHLPGESNRIYFDSKSKALKEGFKAHNCVK